MPTLAHGTLSISEPMANHTSWRVGGSADRFYEPADLEDLIHFVQTHPQEPLIWLGLGSNTLVRDGGIRGTVISTQGCLSGLTQVDELTVRAEAGVSCAQLARFCARLNLGGAEFWAGIPGTVGGALKMNAGCAGSETWPWVMAVETLDHQGVVRKRPATDYQYHYRGIHGPEEWFTAGHFRLNPGNKAESLQLIRDLLAHRTATQPTGDPSAGSTFRNPDGDYAGRLVESCGLKGFQIGGAAVSEKHANFIVNTGTATAADIETLIAHVADTVAKVHKIELIREIHIIGEKA